MVKKKGIHPAILVVWAAVLAAASMLPSLPLIGTGYTFSVASALTPLCGVLFGPIYGAITAIIGGILGQILAPQTAWFGIFSFIPGTVTAVSAGLLIRGKSLGLFVHIGIIIVATIIWFSTSIGMAAYLMPMVGYSLGCIISVGGFLMIKMKSLTNQNALMKVVCMWMICFGAIYSGVAVGNLFGLFILQLPAEMWIFVTFIAPIERAIFAVGATIIGLPLLIILPKIGIFVGPAAMEDNQEVDEVNDEGYETLVEDQDENKDEDNDENKDDAEDKNEDENLTN